MSEVFIYCLCEPETLEVRYIGKTKRPKARQREHLRRKGDTRTCRWIASLSAPPIFRILEVSSDGTWEEAERRQIKLHREMGCDLTNHTDGGDGRTSFLPEEIEKLSQDMKARMCASEFREKLFTRERANKISAALSGKPKSKEHVAKLPQNQKGFKQSAIAVEKKRVAATGKKQPEQWKVMMAERNRGNQWGIGNKSRTGMTNSSEMNDKIGAFFRGRPKTAEQRKKMSDARKKWWAEKRGETGR